MSPAETRTGVDAGTLARQLRDFTEDVLAKGTANQVAPENLRELVSSAVRLYAAATEQTGQEIPPVTEQVSTTECVVLACALLRAQNLTPFEMAVWFSRSTPVHH
ncbi:hypothetical protein GCM10012275_34460 [Longimycelium tulufanense]|uniref:Uncharacterized protein n=1 Tax=Longimycelium tulufanense TaxID=907463 RepID=A0A8J3FWK4_9PSEU|nr:hypothetical protein [Longimycelium tulufanense]GGM60424.1 hypothetical protein GCM10012275_34460 [Longimycelium tulufanense]